MMRCNKCKKYGHSEKHQKNCPEFIYAMRSYLKEFWLGPFQERDTGEVLISQFIPKNRNFFLRVTRIICKSKSKFVKSAGVLHTKSMPNESIGNWLDNFDRSEVADIWWVTSFLEDLASLPPVVIDRRPHRFVHGTCSPSWLSIRLHILILSQ